MRLPGFQPARRGPATMPAAAVLAAVLAVVLGACGGPAETRGVPGEGVPGRSSTATDGMAGMDMSGTGDDMPGLAEPSGPAFAAAAPADTGLHATVGGYTYVTGAATSAAGSAAPFTFQLTGPGGKPVTRFQPYEGQLLVFYLVRTDLGDFHRLTASMRGDGTWTVPMPALAAGSYRTYVTFAAPDSSAGTPLTYTLSRPLTVAGAATAAEPPTPPAPADTAAVDGYTLRLSGSPRPGADTDFAVAVAAQGRPVRQFDRVLDGYAHLTAIHSGDAAFARALSTGRAAGGPAGAGALTARISFPERGAWRLFVEFQVAGVEHVASFTVTVP